MGKKNKKKRKYPLLSDEDLELIEETKRRRKSRKSNRDKNFDRHNRLGKKRSPRNQPKRASASRKKDKPKKRRGRRRAEEEEEEEEDYDEEEEEEEEEDYDEDEDDRRQRARRKKKKQIKGVQIGGPGVTDGSLGGGRRVVKRRRHP